MEGTDDQHRVLVCAGEAQGGDQGQQAHDDQREECCIEGIDWKSERLTRCKRIVNSEYCLKSKRNDAEEGRATTG